jgi:hypothetical protein
VRLPVLKDVQDHVRIEEDSHRCFSTRWVR